MSVRVMSWVWEHSQSKGTDRLVLLAVADCAADNGGNAYPSMAALVRKTGLSTRTVQQAIRRLAELGELAVALNTGPGGCNRYRIRMTPAGSAPPQDLHPANPAPLNDVHPPEADAPPPPHDVHHPPAPRAPGTVLEPSLEPSETSSSSAKPPKAELAIPERQDVEQVCRHLADRIEANGSKRPTITKTWRDAARRLLDRDGRTVEQIIRAIDWSQDDDFWRSNILSMPTLREKYDRLRLAAQRSNGTAPKRSTTDQRVAEALALAARFEGAS